MGLFHLLFDFSISKHLGFYILCFNISLILDSTTLDISSGVILCECFDLACCLGAHAQPEIWCEVKNLWKSWKQPHGWASFTREQCQGGPATNADLQQCPLLPMALLDHTLTVTLACHKPELSPYPLTWGHATVLQKRCTKPCLLAEIKPCIFVFLLLTKVLRLWVLLPNWTMVTFVSKPCWSCYCKLILWQPGFLLPCWSRQI